MGPAGYQPASLCRNLSAAKQKLKELDFPELGGQGSQPPRAACVAKVSLQLRENYRLQAVGRDGARALQGTCAILGRLTRFACFLRASAAGFVPARVAGTVRCPHGLDPLPCPACSSRCAWHKHLQAAVAFLEQGHVCVGRHVATDPCHAQPGGTSPPLGCLV